MSVIAMALFPLFRAAAKATVAKVRARGWAAEHPQWAARAEICERCPLRVIQCNRAYCGRPFLQQPHRDPLLDGCGCPCREKAKDPAEHCPLTSDHQAASRSKTGCNCKWCSNLPH